MGDASATETVQTLLLGLLPQKDFAVPVFADEFIDRELKARPELLSAYVDEQLHGLIVEEVAHLIRAARRRARTNAPIRAFAAAAQDAEEAMEEGDYDAAASALSGFFSIPLVIDDVGTYRRIGEMTGTDHEFVAARKRHSAVQAQMEAAFHVAVAKKVGEKRTEEVMTEEQYQTLYASIVRREPETKAS